jgi:hypothetical protein
MFLTLNALLSWPSTNSVFSCRYRYQLEAFVDRIKGREPQTWITPENSILNMETIDAVYKMVSISLVRSGRFDLNDERKFIYSLALEGELPASSLGKKDFS